MARKPAYGRGHSDFLEYERFIVTHPAYQGMPDVYLDDGGIQWEAPSNRRGGKFKDTHHHRREWWRRKAIEVGIDPNSAEWISRTAKLIHPTKKRPCKVCGRVMDIRYAYPARLLLTRLSKLEYIDNSFPLDPLEHIMDLVPRLVEQFGERVFEDLPALLKASSVDGPRLPARIQDWLKWLDEVYIPSEPSTLSPGAMSNAPDRLDGFHSFNLCCRARTDPGRTAENLQSYTTDRRVFEYWVDGNWVAADRLMGCVRADPLLKREPCLHGHPGPCAADHIGPISLGFCHRPEFQLLCHTCNSAKNNRMYYSDVAHLRDVEQAGELVASWYCQDLWDLRKHDVVNEETALRLSKLLRDNRHTAMHFLHRIASEGHLTFLATFLGLEYAAQDPMFVDLRIERHITRFDTMLPGARTTKYAAEQKARRLRVAFVSLRDYIAKESRNAFIVSNGEIEGRIDQAIEALRDLPEWVRQLDYQIHTALEEAAPSDELLRELVSRVPSPREAPEPFAIARQKLCEAMALVAAELSARWTDDRYVRQTPEEQTSLL